MLVSKQIQYSH